MPKGFAPITVLLIIAILILGGGVVVYQRILVPPTLRGTPTPTITPAVSQLPSVVSPSQESYSGNTEIPNQKKYISSRLGISFLYLGKIGNDVISVKEAGNKVYIYSEGGALGGGNYLNGQYVEIFTKAKEAGINKTLKTQFLSNYSENDCKITNDYLTTGTKGNYPSSYKVTNIAVAGTFDNLDALFEKLRKCPIPYTQSNGVSFFLFDTEHPKTFVFFSIGQYAITADEHQNLAWQDTFRFLD